MALKKDNDYYKMLEELAVLSYDAAIGLEVALRDFSLDTIEARKANLHQIEHNADIKKHNLINKLIREFITPIDREDIILLADEIDNVTDAIEDVFIKIYMYNISQIKPEAIEFAGIIVKLCDAMSNMLSELHDFRKSKKLNDYIIDINALEEDGDRLHVRAMHKLFKESVNPIELIIWKDTFDIFESCCDQCEHVSDVVEKVIMKNS